MKFIDSKYSLPEFLDLLNTKSINYVILRWFYNYTSLAAQKDIDFLIADKDVTSFMDLLVKETSNGSMKVDVYSVSGLKGSNYRKFPYYPKYLAEKILNSRVQNPENYWVPSPKNIY